MNTNMYVNQATQDNLKKLRCHGVEVIEPAEGILACGDTGAGRMPEPDELLAHIEKLIGREKTQRRNQIGDGQPRDDGEADTRARQADGPHLLQFVSAAGQKRCSCAS